MENNNLILRADSYKFSHYLQYPEGTEGYFGYIESRGGEYDDTVFFGLQIFLKKYLTKPITQENIDEAEEFSTLHGVPFNKEGWEYILKEYDGYIPVTIKAAPEGSVIPVLNALVTVEVTDPKVFWVGSYLETALLRAVWYPTTVATVSYNCKKIIMDYLKKTSDDPEGQIAFKLHDFGARGVSSAESAEIGGAAHLINFMGSDTVEGVWTANKYYDIEMAGFSIPASEHSTITCWGKESEVDAYRNMLKQYAKPGALIAVVSDSYDIYNAAEKLWGETLKQEVIDSEAIVVIRPDSGDPKTVVLKLLNILGEKFGYKVNAKGYDVLNNVRVIQGDGITIDTIEEILEVITKEGWSADNVAFGMGGGLLQMNNRDTMKFAMKCSAIKINGEWRDVFKDPVTDKGKVSKRGRISLFENSQSYKRYDTKENIRSWTDGWLDEHTKEVLVPVYKNGKLLKEYTFAEVRENAK